MRAAALARKGGFNCATCPKAYPCDTVQEWVEGIESECPAQDFDGLAIAFETAANLQNNILPHSGGFYDQPAKLMQYAKIIQGAFNE